METSSVVSADGTVIGFERLGRGPPLLAVHGGVADRTRWAPVKDMLAETFTVHLVDRRGRGLSAEVAEGPYSIEREGEDIASVLEAIGEPTLLVGHSYGAMVALEAALRSDQIGAMVLYEPGASTPGHVVTDDAVLDRIEELLAEGKPEDALVFFFVEVVGVAAVNVEAMRGTPVWEARLAVVPTILREGRVTNDFPIDAHRFEKVDMPVTVFMGTDSPEWARSAARATHEALPGSRLVVLEGQGHIAMDSAPELFVAEVITAGQQSSSPQ